MQTAPNCSFFYFAPSRLPLSDSHQHAAAASSNAHTETNAAPKVGPAAQQAAGDEDDAAEELWEADWDDTDAAEDFQSKLRRELDRRMKD